MFEENGATCQIEPAETTIKKTPSPSNHQMAEGKAGIALCQRSDLSLMYTSKVAAVSYELKTHVTANPHIYWSVAEIFP